MPFILETILKYPKCSGIPIHCPQLHSFYHNVTASFLLVRKGGRKGERAGGERWRKEREEGEREGGREGEREGRKLRSKEGG